MAIYVVKQGNLYIRSSPQKVDTSNIVAVLHEGTPMEVIDDSGATWWKVEVQLAGLDDLIGYVGKSGLVPKGSVPVATVTAAPAAAVPAPKVPPVHYREGKPSVTRLVPAGASPLGEPDMPKRTKGDGLATAPLLSFIDWAKVDLSTHKRWKPTGQTFCNIYAYDYCYAAGIYIPRVWWMPKAIETLKGGGTVDVVYGTSIREMNANSLHDWLNDWGSDHGWERATSVDALQQQVNGGAVGVICARRKLLSRSGHITVVAPEHGAHKAHREGGKVVLPLQSQAGASNVRYGAAGAPTVGKAWWAGAQFDSFVFFYNRTASRWT